MSSSRLWMLMHCFDCLYRIEWESKTVSLDLDQQVVCQSRIPSVINNDIFSKNIIKYHQKRGSRLFTDSVRYSSLRTFLFYCNSLQVHTEDIWGQENWPQLFKVKVMKWEMEPLDKLEVRYKATYSLHSVLVTLHCFIMRQIHGHITVQPPAVTHGIISVGCVIHVE